MKISWKEISFINRIRLEAIWHTQDLLEIVTRFLP